MQTNRFAFGICTVPPKGNIPRHEAPKYVKRPTNVNTNYWGCWDRFVLCVISREKKHFANFFLGFANTACMRSFLWIFVYKILLHGYIIIGRNATKNRCCSFYLNFWVFLVHNFLEFLRISTLYKTFSFFWWKCRTQNDRNAPTKKAIGLIKTTDCWKLGAVFPIRLNNYLVQIYVKEEFEVLLF